LWSDVGERQGDLIKPPAHPHVRALCRDRELLQCLFAINVRVPEFLA
jgi:hypothetical protein